MSYTFLLDAGEESWADSFSAIPASVLSRLNLTAEKSCYNDNGTESCQGSLFGMTCEPSTELYGKEILTLWQEGSLARTSVLPGIAQDLKEPKADSGNTWLESFAKFNPVSCSWKIRQLSLFEDLEPFLEIWPKWGSMRNGECWELPMPSGLKELRSLITNAFDALSRLPTPTVCGNYNRKGASPTSGDGLATALRRLPTPTASDKGTIRQLPKRIKYTAKGTLRHLNADGIESQCRLQQQIAAGGPMNPEWVEWFMGWPIGMTALQPLEMAKFQQWLNSHGKLSPEQ